MGWSDVVIGNGENIATSFIILDDEITISSNSNLYRISNIFYGCGMTIYKNTPEYDTLTDMIEHQISRSCIIEIKKYVTKVLLKHIEPSVLADRIEQRIKESFNDGIKHNQRQIIELLGISDYV